MVVKFDISSLTGCCPAKSANKFFILSAFLTCFLFLFNVFGQDDPRAQKIIDDMTAAFKKYPTVSLSFSANVSTQIPEKTEMQLDGKIWVKNTMYKLETPDFVIFFNGSTIEQYLPDAQEVNIMKPDPNENNEDFQLLNPQTYFNLSSKSFKSNLVKESTQNGRVVSEIDLYPIHLKTTKYSRIRVLIEKSTLQLTYLKAFMKDGTHYELTFKPYAIFQTALPDSFFSFDKLEFPNVEIIDLSF